MRLMADPRYLNKDPSVMCEKHTWFLNHPFEPRCRHCWQEEAGPKVVIPEDRFDTNPIPWTQRPVSTYVYKYPVGEIFTPIAPEGTVMFTHTVEDDARLEDALRMIFPDIKE